MPSPAPLVVPIHHSPFNIAKSYLLVGARVVIVDTGPPDAKRQGHKIRRALAECGRSRDDVSLILATHSHPDHVGNTVALRDWCGAPVAIDPKEAAFVAGTDRLSRTPTGLAGRLFLRTPLPHQGFELFTPDLSVDDAFELRHFGVNADVHRCGGHTPGSLAVHCPGSGELIAADLFAGGVGIGGLAFHGRVIEPPFHEDRATVIQAAERLLALGGLTKIHVCHGGPLGADNVGRWVRRAKSELARRPGAPS
jgi:glyoxylase-like metal-dependent hydrolase (beta-lactamase superfamily II)